MDLKTIEELLLRYREGNCSASEKELVERWCRRLVDTGDWQWERGEKEAVEKILENRIRKQIEKKEGKAEAPVFQFPKYFWRAAVGIIMVAGALSYFILSKDPAAVPEQIAINAPADVKAPELNRAVITLSDGQKILLDSVDSGTLSVQGNMKLVKLPGGEIVYQNAPGERMHKPEYNTISNPRGSKVISVVLADGSKVWLNAGSNLTYPVAFTGKDRSVSIHGEAYFEVMHDESKPFIVSSGMINVKVIGTHFNINTFKDDGQNIEVTLLEGSVRVNSGSNNGLLKPGQQASIGTDLKVIKNVDLDAVMAWKNGYFHFEDASLKNVMERISRWYDINVIYTGEIQPRKFVGEMQSDLSLSEVLKILEKNKIHFKIMEKELIVSP